MYSSTPEVDTTMSVCSIRFGTVSLVSRNITVSVIELSLFPLLFSHPLRAVIEPTPTVHAARRSSQRQPKIEGTKRMPMTSLTEFSDSLNASVPTLFRCFADRVCDPYHRSAYHQTYHKEVTIRGCAIFMHNKTVFRKDFCFILLYSTSLLAIQVS